MDAKIVETQIKEKLGVIGNSIASFVSADEKTIYNKLAKLNFYVYDDYYSQKNRLINIDLYKIAYEYSTDVIDELILDDKREEEILASLTKLILASYSLNEESLKKEIEKFVNENKEFSSSKKAAFNNIKGAINNFLRDYESKSIIDNISLGKKNREDVLNIIYSIQASIIKKRFNIAIKDAMNVKWFWETIYAFSNDENDLKDCSEEYVEHINGLKIKFYKHLKCRGNNLSELENDAKAKGIVMNKETCYRIECDYKSEFIKQCKASLKMYTNIFDIYDDLKSKGYYPDETNIIYLFNNPSVYGVNFQILGKDGMNSYIIFNNDEVMYTSEFTDTCIHEIIHYLGGNNSKINKRGLYYNDNKIYLDLEEAYVNALTKRIKSDVEEKVGAIVTPFTYNEASNLYDHTLEYMNFVFKHYMDELSEIHLSDNISLSEAKKLIPIDTIAKGVSRIMNCDKKDVKQYTLEEIGKLKRNRKA